MNDEMMRNSKRFNDLLCKGAKNVNVVDLLRKIYGTFLDNKSSALELIVYQGLKSFTDGKKIVVSLIPDALKDKYSNEDWLVLLKAILAHESQHVNSSNFEDIEKIRNWYGKKLAQEAGVDESVGAQIGQNMLNIIEDGRIEAIAVQRRPGMFLPFMYLNQIIREGTEIKEVADNASAEFADFVNNILSYAKTGLYSPGIEMYANTRLEEYFLKIEALIDDGVKARSSYDCRTTVKKILETATPYIKELLQDEALQNKMKQPSSPEYSSNNENQYNDGDSNSLRSDSPTNEQENGGQGANGELQEKDDKGEKNKESNQSPESNQNQSGNQPQDDPASTPSQQSGKGVGFSNAKRAEPLSNERMDEIRDQMSRQLKAPPIPKPAPSSHIDKKGLKKVMSAYKEPSGNLRVLATKIPTNLEVPQSFKIQAEQLRREIKKIVDDRRQASRNLRRGALNVSALWKTGLGDDTIFERRNKVDKSSIAFYILIDNSGSMRETAGGDLKKYEAARSAAAIIEEASKAILPCKIALFNQARADVNHRVVKDFDEKQKGNLSWNSLKVIFPEDCNADSVNIRIAAEELSKRRENRKVLFVLSDGLPSAYDSQENARREVRQAVKDARNAGIAVIPIMFGDENFRKTNLNTYQEMYEKSIISCAPQQITTTLVKTFRSILAR